jgi:hypothetical protein
VREGAVDADSIADRVEVLGKRLVAPEEIHEQLA